MRPSPMPRGAGLILKWHMTGLLISLVNVVIVLASIVLAVYVGSKERAVFYSTGMVVLGVGAYIYEIYSVLATGECPGLGEAVIGFVVGVSKCIGVGGRYLAYAQVLILSGVLVLLFRPLVRLMTKEEKKNNAT